MRMYRVGARIAPGEFYVLKMASTIDEAREFAMRGSGVRIPSAAPVKSGGPARTHR
jgi:hypothetical protein